LFIFPPLAKGGEGGFDSSCGVDMLLYNKNLKQLSRSLRRNMTDAEMLLWSKLRGKQLKGFQFYRQKIIDNYIADFYCPKSKLVIEVDGGQHYSAEGREKDKKRDDYMASVGIAVLRFSDREVLVQLDVVIEKIWSRL
jgi:very-short-patch-repair endonuclease